MKAIYLLPKEEREIYFRSAADIIKIPFNIIEKDYWVVFILEKLFTLNNLKSHLTFKGGTSLSKIYNIIDRFSEDIDLSIEKHFFGFGDNNDPEKAPSKNKQRAILENLSTACSEYVCEQMLINLKNHIAEKIKIDDDWDLVTDPEDPDKQTLLFKYPSITPTDGYIRPFVKIEMGARSEHWPVSTHTIQSYAKQALHEKIAESEILVRVLDAKRTFWEKATILHQYAHLPQNKKLPLRISRHYYDFYCLLNSNIKISAIEDAKLLDRVATHKSIYFASGWASYNTAKKGSLKLSPPSHLLVELEKDFHLMKDMFFGNIPQWNAILKNIRDFEGIFNE